MPDKIITNPVYETALFQAIAPYISSIRPEVLAFELAKTSVHPGCNIKWEKQSVDSCMSWVTTCQGMDFWEKLHIEFEENKREGNVVSDIDHLIP